VDERLPGRFPSRRPRLTGRAAVLALVLCSLVAALAYPMREFVAQRTQIAQQRAAAEQAKHQVEELEREKARWQDPMYVAAQARERLHYALPGETPFTAVDPSAGAGASATGTAYQDLSQQPWYTSLWQSVDRADSAGPTPSATP
jgi:cell division protein FtsB